MRDLFNEICKKCNSKMFRFGLAWYCYNCNKLKKLVL